jgi:hypothetical protein
MVEDVVAWKKVYSFTRCITNRLWHPSLMNVHKKCKRPSPTSTLKNDATFEWLRIVIEVCFTFEYKLWNETILFSLNGGAGVVIVLRRPRRRKVRKVEKQ